jgi:hypothetical protein
MPRTNLLVLAFIIVGVLTAGLTFLFLFLTTEPNYPDLYGQNTSQTLSSGPEPLTVSDLMNPNSTLYNREPRYYLFRKKLARWDKEQVQQYWIAPQEIIIDLLSQKSDKQMEEFLTKIP